MEFRLRPLGFMEYFAKQQLSGSLFCKKLHKTQGSQSKFHESNTLKLVDRLTYLGSSVSSTEKNIGHAANEGMGSYR